MFKRAAAFRNDLIMSHYDDLEIDTDHSRQMDDASLEPNNYAAVSPVDQLERYGRWLSSIPRDDIIVLRETPEYQDFLRSFERLGDAHRRVISMNRSAMSMDESSHHVVGHVPRSFVPPDLFWSFTNNFMQHLTADDVILRVFEFLECHSLIRMALTCSRFRQLAYRSATQRTYDVANSRQLNSVMQLLRAKEQIDGVGDGMNDSHVRVPILLLSRRVLVTNAGDPELNGVYFCTGSNGNGFLFTKPKYPEQRLQRTNEVTEASQVSHGTFAPMERRRDGEQGVVPPPVIADANMGAVMVGPEPIDQGPSALFESEVAQPGQLLRCFIAKRFSNETILWYLSKEVVVTESREGVQVGQVTQVYSFWAKLMVIGDASPDICRYPSQSSILARHNEGWQALSTTRAMRPPTVELLD